MSADKGNATMVMSTTDYDHQVNEILSTNTYQCLPRNPSPVIERTLTTKLCTLYQAQVIDNTTYHHLKPSAFTCPRFFCQPKIHKPDGPLRPIVASQGSPSYNIATHLTKNLHRLVGLTEHHINNTSKLVDIIKHIHLRPTDILVSFDVVSLFTNIPIEEACNIANQSLQAEPTLTDRTSLTPEQVHDLLITSVYASSFRW